MCYIHTYIHIMHIYVHLMINVYGDVNGSTWTADAGTTVGPDDEGWLLVRLSDAGIGSAGTTVAVRMRALDPPPEV
jgi:hypothetical protein